MQRELRRDSIVDGILDGDAPLELDVLVIGGGFAGCYLLHNLRKQNFSVKVVEAGTGLGGIWHWNAYPGARVDSQYPVYQLSLPEVYNTWRGFTQHYPDSAELRSYFQHMDDVLHLSKDVYYRTTVLGADFDRDANKWTVYCQNGKRFRTSFLIASVGFAARRHVPDWPGLETFAGEIKHSSFWPHEGVDISGKKTAVIGTGATGVQIIQEWAKQAGELTVFQRTPNMAIPMRQANLSPEELEAGKSRLAEDLAFRMTTDGGFLYMARKELKMLQQTPEAREQLFNELWNMGGFRFIANNFGDMMTDPVANRHAYDFWCRNQRARIHDPKVADILVPLEPPHAFSGKRPSLEQDYYDVFNRPNVHIINVRQNGIKEVVPEGIITQDGELHKFDVIALATGFDSLTGGLKDIALRGSKSPDAPTLSDYWTDGAKTYLGMTVHGYPNFFFTYGPQAPTAFSNGPSCVEPQANWIVAVLQRMRNEGLQRLEARRESEKWWREEVMHWSQKSLRHHVDGWYNGQNIPGKPREPLNYAGGLPRYQREIKAVLDQDFKGFDVQRDIWRPLINKQEKKAEEVPKPEEAPKTDEASKPQEAPNAEEVFKTTEIPKVEEMPKAEEIPKENVNGTIKAPAEGKIEPRVEPLVPQQWWR